MHLKKTKTFTCKEHEIFEKLTDLTKQNVIKWGDVVSSCGNNGCQSHYYEYCTDEYTVKLFKDLLALSVLDLDNDEFTLYGKPLEYLLVCIENQIKFYNKIDREKEEEKIQKLIDTIDPLWKKIK